MSSLELINPSDWTAPASAPEHSLGSYELILEAGRAEKNYWRDLWRYRELFQVLAWRDVSVRYKQTVIGVAWALIRPFLTMIVFTVIFGSIAKLPSDGAAPYALLVFAGMLPWTFFSTALADASNSLVANSNLISKVYFPRLIVPAATSTEFFYGVLRALVALRLSWQPRSLRGNVELAPRYVRSASQSQR